MPGVYENKCGHIYSIMITTMFSSVKKKDGLMNLTCPRCRDRQHKPAMRRSNSHRNRGGGREGPLKAGLSDDMPVCQQCPLAIRPTGLATIPA